MATDSTRTDLGYGRFAGWYLMALGTVLVAGDLLRLLRGVYPPVHFGPGLLFLLFGWQVAKGCNGFRKATIVLCVAVTLVSVGMLAGVVAAGKPWSSLWLLGFDVEDPGLPLVVAALVANVFFVAVPLVALLHPKTRRAFRALPSKKDPLDLSDFFEPDTTGTGPAA